MQTKKPLIIMILNELSVNSDEKNPRKQTDIAEKLSGKKYHCDRKTVCRNIKFLREMGYPIVKTPKGFYMDIKVFSADELAFIKSAILSAEGKSSEEKEVLSERVAIALSKMFKQEQK